MGKKTWLNLFALSDEYDRCARLAPALTSLLPLLPLTITLGGSLVEWGAVLGGTTGVFALGWLALANLASVFGNRLQKQLWPNWPFDAPTNVRLMPDNPDTSPQQRSRWYGQIKKITGLDLQAEAGAKKYCSGPRHGQRCGRTTPQPLQTWEESFSLREGKHPIWIRPQSCRPASRVACLVCLWLPWILGSASLGPW